jgi:Holliday junction resolvase-like predicted endonuclease
MSVEANVITSILKLTKEGAVSCKWVTEDSKVASSIVLKLLRKLQKEHGVYLEDGLVQVNSHDRLSLAVKAISSGADAERISSFLCWQEFEEIAAIALLKNGYTISKNVRFKSVGRRWEIDVVGCKKPIVLCVDCKHYHRQMHPSRLREIVEAQIERTQTLAETLPCVCLQLECIKWDRAKFMPAILSLIPSSFKFFQDVPVIPVLQLQDFLCQLPAYSTSLRYFAKEFTHLPHE